MGCTRGWLSCCRSSCYRRRRRRDGFRSSGRRLRSHRRRGCGWRRRGRGLRRIVILFDGVVEGETALLIRSTSGGFIGSRSLALGLHGERSRWLVIASLGTRRARVGGDGRRRRLIVQCLFACRSFFPANIQWRRRFRKSPRGERRVPAVCRRLTLFRYHLCCHAVHRPNPSSFCNSFPAGGCEPLSFAASSFTRFCNRPADRPEPGR